MADQTYIIEFRDDGAARVANNTRKIGTAGEKSSKQIGQLAKSLKTAALGLAAYVSIREFTSMSDEWIKLNSAVRVVTNSEEELISTRGKLIAMSKENRSEIGASAKLYQRLMMAQKSLGKSSQEVLNFTNLIQKSLIINSASGEEARSALIQLSQGMSDTTFKAEEFNAVMVAIPSVLMGVADAYGTSTKGLKDMLSAGEITTAQFFDKILELAPQINKQMSEVGVTFSQAGSNMKTSMIELIGEIDKLTKISTMAAQTISTLALNLRKLVAALVAVSAVAFVSWASKITFTYYGWTVAVMNLKIAYFSLITVMKATIPLMIKTIALTAAFFGVFEAAKTFFAETKAGAKTLLELGMRLELAQFRLKNLDFRRSAEEQKQYDKSINQIISSYDKMIFALDKEIPEGKFGEKLLGNITADIKKTVDYISGSLGDIGDDLVPTEDSVISPDFWDNLSASFGKFSEQFGLGMKDAISQTKTLGDIFAETLTDAVRGFSDEFAAMVVDGKANFKDMARSIIKDLISMIIQQQIFNAISDAANSGNSYISAIGKAFGGKKTGNQFGGSVQAGVPTMVGERRPEIFVPQSAGKIIPYPKQDQQQQSIRIVNAVSGDAVLQNASRSVIDKIVMNAISDNTNALRGMLA